MAQHIRVLLCVLVAILQIQLPTNSLGKTVEDCPSPTLQIKYIFKKRFPTHYNSTATLKAYPGWVLRNYTVFYVSNLSINIPESLLPAE